MSTPCLRCQQPLEEHQVDTITARFCVACQGMLLKHADLIAVAEQSWRFVPEKTARFTDFHAKDALQKEPPFHCPDCHKPMEKYGYMGYAAIPIDRCDGCALVWLDSDELQNIVLALAKNKYRVERGRRDAKTALDLTDIGLSAAEPDRRDWLFADPDDGSDRMIAMAQLLLRLVLRV